MFVSLWNNNCLLYFVEKKMPLDGQRWQECDASYSLLHCRSVTLSQKMQQCGSSFSLFSFWAQLDLSEWELKKQPAADAFSISLLKKSALEAQCIIPCHFQVTITLQPLSWNCLIPKDPSLLLKLKNTSLEKYRAFFVPFSLLLFEDFVICTSGDQSSKSLSIYQLH